MNLIPIILATLLTLPTYYKDKETDQERSARMLTVATAIVSVSNEATCQGKGPWMKPKKGKCKKTWYSSREALMALLITQGFHESRFSKNVHDNKCKKYECDPYKDHNGVIRHRAKSSWQIQRHSISVPFWNKMTGVGLNPTRNAAYVASKILISGKGKCSSIKGAIAMYATGSHCSWTRRVNKHTYKGSKSNLVKCKPRKKKEKGKSYLCIDEGKNRLGFYRMTLGKINNKKAEALRLKKKNSKSSKKKNSKSSTVKK